MIYSTVVTFKLDASKSEIERFLSNESLDFCQTNEMQRFHLDEVYKNKRVDFIFSAPSKNVVMSAVVASDSDIISTVSIKEVH